MTMDEVEKNIGGKVTFRKLDDIGIIVGIIGAYTRVDFGNGIEHINPSNLTLKK